MDTTHFFQVCFFIIFFTNLGLSYNIDEDYEDGPSFGRCPWIRNKLKNGRVRYRYKGRVAKFLCDSGYELAGKRSSTCVRGKWSNPVPVCVARGCTRVPSIPNGRVTEMYRGALLVYDCNPGYILNGEVSIHCDGRRWSTVPPTCVVGHENPETFCDFESPDLCGWSHDPTHDFDWKRNQFSTPSGHVGTGPSYDHTFGENKGGYYLYIEASSPRKINDTARLFSPVYFAEASGGCFVFWYHMYGATTGGLRVYLKPESYVFDELKPTWEKYGDQGNQWQRGSIPIPVFHENFQIVIEGIRGESYVGDSAIDDVLLTKNDCSSAENDTDTIEHTIEDSCRGRCREVDSGLSCSCNDNCYAAQNCCSDYNTLCFQGNDTVVQSSDEPSPVDVYGKTTNPVTVAVSPTAKTTESRVLTEASKIATKSSTGISTGITSSDAILTTSTFSPTTSITVISSTESFPSTMAKSSNAFLSPTSPPSVSKIPSTTLQTTEKPITSVKTTKISPILTTTSLKSTPIQTTISSTIPVKTTVVLTTPIPTTTATSTTSIETTATTTTPITTTAATTTPITTIPTTMAPVTTTAATPIPITTTTSTTMKSTPPIISSTSSSIFSSTQSATIIPRTTYITVQSTTLQSSETPPSIEITTTSSTRRTYNLRPRTKRTTTPISSVTYASETSSIGQLTTKTTAPSTNQPTTISVENKQSSTSVVTSNTKWHYFTVSPSSVVVKPTLPVQSTTIPTTMATTATSTRSRYVVQTTAPTIPARYTNRFMTSAQTFPPSTTDSRKMEASNSESTAGNSSLPIVIPLVVVAIICAAAGGAYYIRKQRNKRQSKLSDDSEMRFLPESEFMEYSDASSLDRILGK